ncbi:MAG TPA: hypothetical protein VFF37_10060, partial [Streptomyces sp.]|nr:hypothetical protein [Streptomyces sp.]
AGARPGDPQAATPEQRTQTSSDATAGPADSVAPPLSDTAADDGMDALPEPAVSPDFLQTDENLTDTGPALSTDDPAAAPYRPVNTTSSALFEDPAPPPAGERDTRVGARLRPGPGHPVEERQAPRVEEHSVDVPKESLTSGWGVSRDNYLLFQAFADQGKLVIDVRPRNVDSVKWLTLGALPKPEEIKAKTVNALDVRLGAPEDKRGLVGFFEPRLPVGVSADDPVHTRYQRRLKEYQSLRNQMDELAEEGRYRTVDGVVHAVLEDGTLRPLAGDLDIFRMTRLDGSPLSAKQYGELVENMKNSAMDVMHGAHLNWNPQDSFGRDMYRAINEAHRLDGGAEPLLRFVAHRGSSTVAYTDSASNATPDASRTGSTDEDLATPHGDERTLDGTSGKGKARALDGALSRDPSSVSATSTASEPNGEKGEKGAFGTTPVPPLSDDAKLAVGRRFSALMREIGHPVVLAGGARGRVQFGNPRPLGTLEFHLPADVGRLADVVNRAIAQWFPGVSPNALRLGADGRSLTGVVQGAEISIGIAPHTSTDTTETDGFTVPAVTESLADTAYTLALATDEQQRARDLFDLLWGLSQAPADDALPAARLEALRGDAYRSARPSGAAPTLTVRLSELLDGVARNAHARSENEAKWRTLGAVDDDRRRLNDELTTLADALRATDAVASDPIRQLVSRLPGMPEEDRTHELALLSPAERERLASDPALVDALRQLPVAEFAKTAAQLMVQIPAGVDQPVSARDEAQAQIARMLRDPDVTEQLLKKGARMIVVPKSEAMTSLDPFRDLAGRTKSDGRSWDEVRGIGRRTAGVTEENLLGEVTSVPTTDQPAHPDGYSTTLHEFAHTIHAYGLSKAWQQEIHDAYRATLDEYGALWPDGVLHGMDGKGRRTGANYSSRDELEFFAQLTNVYLRANGGTDPYTWERRQNGGPDWVRRHQPKLFPLMQRLYGEDPEAVYTGPVNPVDATQLENETYEGFRALWDQAEGIHVPQPHTPAPVVAPPVRPAGAVTDDPALPPSGMTPDWRKLSAYALAYGSQHDDPAGVGLDEGDDQDLDDNGSQTTVAGPNGTQGSSHAPTATPQPHAPVSAPQPTAAPGAASTQTSSSVLPPPPPGAEPSAPQQADDSPESSLVDPPRTLEGQLALRRPVRVDRALVRPGSRARDVLFSDGTRRLALGPVVRRLLAQRVSEAPVHDSGPGPVGQADSLLGLGLQLSSIRAVPLLVKEILTFVQSDSSMRPRVSKRKGDEAVRLRGALERVLTQDAGGVLTEGRDITYMAEGKVQRRLRLRLRPYGQGEKFTGQSGTVERTAVAWKGTETLGSVATVNTARAVNPMIALAPLALPVWVFARVGLRFGQARAMRYRLTSQVAGMLASRTHQEPAVHLDHAWVEVQVLDASGGEVGGDNFALRHGLLTRFENDAKPEETRSRIPKQLTFTSRPHTRLAATEEFGPLTEVRDWAIADTGAAEGTALHDYLAAYFTSENFERLGNRLSVGRVVTEPLFAGKKKDKPLGVLTVSVVSQQGLFLSDSVVHRIRQGVALAASGSSRQLTKTNLQQLQLAFGPAFQFLDQLSGSLDFRLVLAAVLRGTHSSARATSMGGSASVQTIGDHYPHQGGAARYLVLKAVTVQRSGRDRSRPVGPDGLHPPYEPKTFVTWAVDRLPHAEARRLAGWDDGSRLRLQSGAGEPFAPPYLTPDHPPTLGLSRVEKFSFDDGAYTKPGPDGAERTWLEHLTDEVLEAAAQVYPQLVAPLSDLDPKSKRWRNRTHFELVVANTMEVMRSLSEASMTMSLESMMSTGLRIALREHGRARRGYRYLWVDAELTGRRYEGTQNEYSVETSIDGDELLGSAHTVTHTVEGGLEGQAALSGTAEKTSSGRARQAGGVTGGLTGGSVRQRRNAMGPAATFSQMAAETSLPPHLFSYQLQLNVSRGGYWRLPALLRGMLTGGVLGTQPFVFKEARSGLALPEPASGPLHDAADDATSTDAADLDQDAALDDGSGSAAVSGFVGRVLLSVSSSHESLTNPDGPDNPYVVSDSRITTRRLDASDPFVRSAARPGQAQKRPAATDFSRHFIPTITVTAHQELTGAARRALSEASHGSWHLTLEGAPGHDSALSLFKAPYITANLDQTMSPVGYRTGVLWAAGPYLNRSGVLVHRMTLADMQVMSAAHGSEVLQGHIASMQFGGLRATGYNVVTGLQFFGSPANSVGTGGTGAYGLAAVPWQFAKSTAQVTSMTAAAGVLRIHIGRGMLVSATAHHELAAASSSLGTMSAVNKPYIPDTFADAAGYKVTIPGGWTGVVPEKSAFELGLQRDGFGPVPRYSRFVWMPQPWMEGRRFGTYAVNTLDAAGVLARFEAKLGGLFTRESDREAIRKLVSARVTRTLRGEMTAGGGATVPARVGRWGWDVLRVGGRTVRVKAELIPGEKKFNGLDHSSWFLDAVTAGETRAHGTITTSGRQLGTTVTQRGQFDETRTSDLGASYATTGVSSTRRSDVEGETDGDEWAVALTGAYAEHTTAYRLKLSMEIDNADPGTGPELVDDGVAASEHDERTPASFTGPRPFHVEGEVGELVTHTNLGLTLPSRPSAAVDLPDVGPVRPAPLPSFTSGKDWREVRLGDGNLGPFQVPDSGFVVIDVMGAPQVQDSARRALAKAYDIRFRDDGRSGVPKWVDKTGLTAAASPSDNTLRSATADVSLAAFAPRALSRTGYQPPNLIEDDVIGGAQGALTLHARPHLQQAVLLTVVNDAHQTGPTVKRQQWEHADIGHAQGANTNVGVTGTTPTAAGTPAPGLPVTGPNAGGFDTLPSGADALGWNGPGITDVPPGRNFLFAIPTDWLAVAQVHRSFKDSKFGRALLSPLHALGSKRFVNAGQKAYETKAPLLVWVTEPVARDLGLITEENYPANVAAAWDAVKDAEKAWVDADKAYWNARRGFGTEPLARYKAAEARVAAAITNRDRLEPRVTEPAPDAELPWVQWNAGFAAAQQKLAAAQQELEQAAVVLEEHRKTLKPLLDLAEQIAGEHQRVRLGAERLTRWHRLNATPEG